MHYINLYINISYILYIFFRHDKDLENSQWISLTIHEMRKKISATIMDDENKNDLSPILYYGSDFLLTPEDWRDLISADHDSLPIDLPFVQLSANLLKRNIILLPILQKDIEDEIPHEENQKAKDKNGETDVNNQKDMNNGKSDTETQNEIKKFLIVTGDETNEKPPITMLYFPGGQFGPDGHFQSINRKFIDDEVLKNKANYKQAFNQTTLEKEREDIKENHNEDSSNEDEDHNDDFNAPPVAAKGNAFIQTTMLTPQDPAATVILNETKKTQKKKLKRDKNAPVFKIAPGEGKIPEEWLREPSFDIEAFPHLFPDGKYGMHFERPKKITPAKYLPQRIMHVNNMFAKDSDFLFMAQQYLERFALERQINMSMLNGSFVTTENNQIKMIPTDDKFSIFQSIPGTPAYWKKFRNEVNSIFDNCFMIYILSKIIFLFNYRFMLVWSNLAHSTYFLL